MTGAQRGSYTLITPARNEASTLEATIAAVAAQEHLPAAWVIVDDGSDDDTAAIAAAARGRLPMVRVVRRGDRGFDAVGGGVVEAFNAGLAALTAAFATDTPPTRYLGKLDADIDLEPSYYARLVDLMDRDPRLGIASGQNYVRAADGSLEVERHARFHPVGGARLYRRDVFDAISPLVQSPGWDTADVVRARVRGHRTRSFDHLPVVHLRPMGTRQQLSKGVELRGRASYLLGYSPVYFAARLALFATRKPRPLHAVWLARGYARAALTRQPRITSPVERRWLRRFQLRRLVGLADE